MNRAVVYETTDDGLSPSPATTTDCGLPYGGCAVCNPEQVNARDRRVVQPEGHPPSKREGEGSNPSTATTYEVDDEEDYSLAPDSAPLPDDADGMGTSDNDDSDFSGPLVQCTEQARPKGKIGVEFPEGLPT